tara:strand:- start:13345 stop:13680 length:336 start_codon:yes stop_codon:yes gene_type:complete
MGNSIFRYGWASAVNGEPLIDDIARKVWPEITDIGGVQRLYEAGRLMALETRMKLPPKAARMTKDIKATVAAAPALREQFRVEQALAREEAKRAAALRLKVIHYERRLKAA